jgi:hypothetical protein
VTGAAGARYRRQVQIVIQSRDPGDVDWLRIEQRLAEENTGRAVFPIRVRPCVKEVEDDASERTAARVSAKRFVDADKEGRCDLGTVNPIGGRNNLAARASAANSDFILRPPLAPAATDGDHGGSGDRSCRICRPRVGGRLARDERRAAGEPEEGNTLKTGASKIISYGQTIPNCLKSKDDRKRNRLTRTREVMPCYITKKSARNVGMAPMKPTYISRVYCEIELFDYMPGILGVLLRHHPACMGP